MSVVCSGTSRNAKSVTFYCAVVTYT